MMREFYIMTTKLLAFLRENVLAKLVYINILHIQE